MFRSWAHFFAEIGATGKFLLPDTLNNQDRIRNSTEHTFLEAFN